MKQLLLAALLFASTANAQSIRIDGPSVASVGETISIDLYVTPPSWADTLQGVHVRVLDYDKTALTFVGHTNYYPIQWNKGLGLVNSGCGDPDELTNDPYIHLGGHDGFTLTPECPIVIGGCANECFYNEWDPWNTGGQELLVASARFICNVPMTTVVEFAECSNPQYRNYLTWIEWNSDCNEGIWQPDIVGNNLLNDPPTITTNGAVMIDVLSGGPSAITVEQRTWDQVKRLYR